MDDSAFHIHLSCLQFFFLFLFFNVAAIYCSASSMQVQIAVNNLSLCQQTILAWLEGPLSIGVCIVLIALCDCTWF